MAITQFPPPPPPSCKPRNVNSNSNPSQSCSSTSSPPSTTSTQTTFSPPPASLISPSASSTSRLTFDRVMAIGESSTSPPPSPARRHEVEEVSMDEDGDELEEELEDRPIIHIEVRQKSQSTVSPHRIRAMILSVAQQVMEIQAGMELADWEDVDSLRQNVERAFVTEISGGLSTASPDRAELQVYVYRLSEEKVEEFGGSLSENGDEQSVPAASSKDLPARDLENVWENLIYPDSLKDRLLSYLYMSLYFSEAEIDSSIITWNRLVLLHGPPGTGKTTLCRALAQKISIRLADRYPETKLVEINSHSLFSKWFSESGKLVQKLFSDVTDMVESGDTFVVVMIDEVESLTAARSMAGSEPGDALRVVNALLTQLDKLKTRKNVLVLTTSNLSHAIDNAFIDRADIKEYVPLPSPEAIYWMFKTCFEELMTKRVMRKMDIPPWRRAMALPGRVMAADGRVTLDKREELGLGMYELALRCHDVNLSGRFLRRMPIMACARYLSSHSSHSSISSGNGGGRNSPSRSPEKWLEAMKRIVEDERGDREKIGWDRRDAEVEVGSVSAAANGGEGRGKGGMKANGDVPMVQKEEVGVATATKSQVAGGP